MHPGLQAEAQAWCSAHDAGVPAGNPERKALCAAFREVLRGANPSRVFAAERRGRADRQHPRAFIGLRLWHELDTWCERAEYDEQPDPYLDRVVRAVLRQLLAAEPWEQVFSRDSGAKGRRAGTGTYPAETIANAVLNRMHEHGETQTRALARVDEQYQGYSPRYQFKRMMQYAEQELGREAVVRAMKRKALRFVRITSPDPWDSVPAPAVRKSDKPE